MYQHRAQVFNRSHSWKFIQCTKPRLEADFRSRKPIQCVILQEAEVEYVEGYEGEEEDDLEDFDQLAEEEYEDEGKRSPG